MADFYITLPSNSSMTYFPENTLAQFKTKLPRELQLKGNWVIGLSDIMFPTTLALPSETIKIEKISFHMAETFYDEPGDPLITAFSTDVRNFQSPADLIAHINSKMPEHRRSKIKFKVDRNDFASIGIAPGYGITLSKQLQWLLGFREDTTPEEFYNNYSGVAVHYLNAAVKCTMFQLYTLYVYTNIIQPTIVGDKLARLLDIIPVHGGGKSHASI